MVCLKGLQEGHVGAVVAQEMLARGKNRCEFCGREHDLAKCENCPGYGKSCNKCSQEKSFRECVF